MKKVALVLALAMTMTSVGGNTFAPVTDSVYAAEVETNQSGTSETAGEKIVLSSTVELGIEEVSHYVALESACLCEHKILKNDISYSFENGVLTAKGTGVADNSYTKLCSKSDIKEVVISTGVIGVADFAFSECKNIEKVSLSDTVKQIGCHAFEDAKLKSLVIPASVEKMGSDAFVSISKEATVTMPAKYEWACEDSDVLPGTIFDGVKEINLNTNYDPECMEVLRADRINTKSSDPKYKSYKGIVYTKNGKKLVQVPQGTKNLKIRKGCTTISLEAIAYQYDSNNDGDWVLFCSNLKSITIPSTVKKIVNDMNHPLTMNYNLTYNEDDDENMIDTLYKCKWNVSTNKLDGKSLVNLFRISNEKIFNKVIKNPKYKIKQKNGMYISKDGVLLKYTGKASSVTIPKNVKIIGDGAFLENAASIKSVNFDKNTKLKEIGDSAFYETGIKKLVIPNTVKKCGRYMLAYSKVKEIVLPKKCKKIDDFAFYGARKLKKIKLPKSVVSVGNGAFEDTGIEKIVFPKNLKKVGDNAFYDCNELKSIKLNNKLQIIGEWAFSNTKLNSVVIPNSVTRCGKSCFANSNVNSCQFSDNMTVIPEAMFADTKFVNVEIPGNIKRVEGHAFVGDNLQTVELQEGVESIAVDSFYGEWIHGENNHNTKPVEIVIPKSMKFISGNYLRYQLLYSKNSDYSDSKEFKLYDENMKLDVSELAQNGKLYCKVFDVYYTGEVSKNYLLVNYSFK
ncbi:MAG: leucine-rich repeat domain-containing protein [Lachnospiraceae bacterium]|nr:leucine-rich repeat domain-containing protein [Lachnospiraceae bacterium]